MIDDLLAQVAKLNALAKAHLEEKREIMTDRALTDEQLKKYGVPPDDSRIR